MIAVETQKTLDYILVILQIIPHCLQFPESALCSAKKSRLAARIRKGIKMQSDKTRPFSSTHRDRTPIHLTRHTICDENHSFGTTPHASDHRTTHQLATRDKLRMEDDGQRRTL